MAHDLYVVGDAYSMIRAEDTEVSWHALEHTLPGDAGFDAWANHPVFDWKIQRSKVRYNIDREGTQLEMPEQHVLFRSDNNAPLSIVSEDYHVVQPKQVLEFFRDVCERNHLTMDTAGIIQNGRRFWALARSGNALDVGVRGQSDVIKQYVLLASSCDASMATVAKPTEKRVVCRNTLDSNLSNREAAVKVRHTREFNEVEVKIDLGLMDDTFLQRGDLMREMATYNVSVSDAQRWLVELMTGKNSLDDEAVADFMNRSRAFKGFWGGFTNAPGAQQTLWGLVNGVSYTVDHVQGRSVDTRMNSAMFGQGNNLKNAAWDKAMQVITAARAANDVIMTAAA